MRIIAVLLAFLAIAPLLVHANTPWAIHAQTPISEEDSSKLTEVFLSDDANELKPAEQGSVRWTWWSWSDETGSDWPDDDALYRRNQHNLSGDRESAPVTKDWILKTPAVIELSGTVKVVSAEDQWRFIVFDLTITPQLNLSNQTIMYIVLTEDIATDHHRRQTTSLVRELRPEVGFSLKANNTTAMTTMLSADHLDAAGVNLEAAPTGWTYSIAVVGSVEEGPSSGDLLVLRSGQLPASTQSLTASQTWMPLLLTGIALVVVGGVLSAAQRREQSIPSINAAWSNIEGTAVRVNLSAGTNGFNITAWSLREPWSFRGRPPKRRVRPHETATIEFSTKSTWEEDCHLDISIEVDELGAWKQHVWLAPPNMDAKEAE